MAQPPPLTLNLNGPRKFVPTAKRTTTKTSTTKANSNSNGISVNNQNATSTTTSRRNEPMRATMAMVTSTPLNNGSSLVAELEKSTSQRKKPTTTSSSEHNLEEQRLSMAYTVYLQQGVLNKLILDTAALYSKNHADSVTKYAVGSEIVTAYDLIKDELLKRRMQMCTLSYVLECNKFIEIYSQFRCVFEGKLWDLGELQRALESRFNSIAMKDILAPHSRKPTEPNQLMQMDLDDLLRRVKSALEPLRFEKAEEMNYPPKDTKTFLKLFQKTIEELIQSASKAERLIANTVTAQEELLDYNSVLISTKTINESDEMHLVDE